MTTFDETKVKRQSAGTASGGQFAEHTRSAPTTSLSSGPSVAFEHAAQVYANAVQGMHQQIVQEMRNRAPEGAHTVEVEIWREQEDVCYLFRGFRDQNGEEVHADSDTMALYETIAANIPYVSGAAEAGWNVSDDYLSLKLRESNAADDAFDDALTMFKLASLSSDAAQIAEADRRLHKAVEHKIKDLGQPLKDQGVAAIELDWGEGGGLWVKRAVDADGNQIVVTDDEVVNQIDFAASNIRNVNLLELSSAPGGAFTLSLN
jgi:hypothetical protein